MQDFFYSEEAIKAFVPSGLAHTNGNVLIRCFLQHYNPIIDLVCESALFALVRLKDPPQIMTDHDGL